jgi:hypothetical protein
VAACRSAADSASVEGRARMVVCTNVCTKGLHGRSVPSLVNVRTQVVGRRS